MGDRRIERTDRPRDEGLYPERIGKEKKEKEKFSKHPAKQEKEILFATFFSYLKSLFDTYSPSKKLAGKVLDVHAMITHLETLNSLLQDLSDKDLSNSPEFAAKLSEIWKALLEDFDNVEIMERKNLGQVASFREMMHVIKNYPPDSDHHFGYYLLNQAGKDWLPFPFIEMLERLHTEYREEEEESTLNSWMQLIQTVIANLKAGLPFNP